MKSIPLFISFIFAPIVVFAQGFQGEDGTGQFQGEDGTAAGSGLVNPLGDGTTLIGFFQEILDVIMIFAVPIIVFFIIYAGFLYVTAQGNQTKVETAHRALLYAVIGGVLILGAELLLAVIGGTVDALGS